MSRGMLNLRLSSDLRAAATAWGLDHGLKLPDVVRTLVARQLSKEGYYRTGGRSWRGKDREDRENAPADHAVNCMVGGDDSCTPEARP